MIGFMNGRSSWKLVNQKGEALSPLKYSNHKTQEDVVNEVLDALDDHDILFLRGGVGTGKSAIALHIIDYYGKGIITTPTKILEKQYKSDYCETGGMKISDSESGHLDVNLLMGRTNFKCLMTPKKLTPKNLRRPVDCGYRYLPCVRTLPKLISRCAVASECPYWSPVYSPGLCKLLEKRERQTIPYLSTTGAKVFYLAKKPCPYYEQFIHFTKPGAIIMNIAKWEAETWIGRKPKVPIEIIDEGDEYMDGLTYRTSVTRRLLNRISRNELIESETLRQMIVYFEETLDKCGQTGYDGWLYEEEDLSRFLEAFIEMLDSAEHSDFILNVKTRIGLILKYQDVAWAKTTRNPPNEMITVFIPSPDITLKELARRSGKLLFMSATIHDKLRLYEIFKMEDPKFIEAETRFPGTLHIMQPSGNDIPRVNFKNWRDIEFKNAYWHLLDNAIDVAARPCLVQVHAWKYLPDKYKPSDDQRREEYWSFEDDEVRFSTKTDRGIDLRDDLCRSIIIMKYPMPNTEDIVFKTMRKLLGESVFWSYLRDISDRNLVQQCGRAVRHHDDWCEIYTTDGMVFNQLPRLWKGRYTIGRARL